MTVSGAPRIMHAFAWKETIGSTVRVHRAGIAVALLLSAAGFLFASEQEETPAPDELRGDRPVPLRGIELDRPAQVAFRSWPPPELVERLYALPWMSKSFWRAVLFSRPVALILTVSWNRFAQRLFEETLRDPAVLRALNDGYVTVVVSADRRPDIRERYHTGNWPVVAFLLPNGKPILSPANPQGVALPISFGFEPPDRMLYLLEQGQIYWRKWPRLLVGVGEVWGERETNLLEPRQEGRVAEEASDALARWLLGSFDAEHGGFEAAPKYVLGGLAEYAALREARFLPALAAPARTTLLKLVDSPLFDHRDGGVHRIAAAPNWGLLQYEKMLEVNAELVRELALALRFWGEDDKLRSALDGTVGFLLRDLARPGGGFYLAQCADPRSKDGGGFWAAPERPSEAPPVDRLVLSGANATAGAALLRAAARTGDEATERAGREALDLVLARGYEPARGVLRVLEPLPEPFRFLWDQADVAFALADAYETTGERRYLAAAKDIVDFAIHNLAGPGEKIFRDRLPEQAPVGLLANERHPIGPNARLARAMLRLAVHGLGEGYRDRARGILEGYAGDLVPYRTHGIEPALAIEELVRDPVVIRIEGDPARPEVRALRTAALAVPWPWTVVATGPASAAPAAVVEFGTARARVARPAELARQVSEMIRQPSEEKAP